MCFYTGSLKSAKVVGQERAVGRCLRAGDVNHAPGGRSVDRAGAVIFATREVARARAVLETCPRARGTNGPASRTLSVGQSHLVYKLLFPRNIC